jgi:hypothetical protein
MDLLCPSCMQKLTIPDQFGGQMVKCPQCGHAFSAPELPGAAPAYVPPPPAPPAPSPQPVPAPTPVVAPAPAAPAPAPAEQPADGHPATFPPAIPERPAWDNEPAHAEPPPPPAAPEPAHVPLAPPAPSAAPVPTDYRHRRSLHVNPGVLRWVALVAVLGMFVLSFFPWAGRYAGGVPVVTQSAWQAAFGAVDDESKQLPADLPVRPVSKEERAPGAGVWLIFWVLLLILAVLLTLAAVLWELMPTALPAALQKFRPWRWGLVTAVTLLALVLLVLQVVSGFPLEGRVVEEAEKLVAARGIPPTDVRAEVMRGQLVGELHRTAAVMWVTVLNALGALAALLVLWVERRGNRPLPRLDLLW